MVQQAYGQTEAQTHKAKLVTSYNALLEEFSAKDLHTVGNYTVGALIGKGSFGKVYLASHKLINRSKVVLKSANKDDPNLAREIHHHRQFLHPHIARLYEVIVTETLVWLVLEYCPGDELYYYLTQHGPLEPEKVKKIFTQLLGAVSYVHQKSCVHRDLKLENILLDKNEDVKLCDFGFTREYEGKSNYLQTWCGTVCYSAPEMLKGERYAGEKVDVWSLGVILYALLTGELPFDEEDDDATKVKILNEEPKYPDTLPVPAKDLLTSLLSKRTLLRPSLKDLLTNPWLTDYAPAQQAILKIQQPPPFTTPIETETLQRMRSAGVNIDTVIENVLSQRCDALAGWWALLLEKEERKERRRLQRRLERDLDVKAKRRISTASGRLLAATIQEADEERSSYRGSAVDLDDRGRSPSRIDDTSALPTPLISDGPIYSSPQAKTSVFPRAPDRRTYRPPSTSSRSRRRSQVSQLGPGIPTGKRTSMLQVVATEPPAPISDNLIKKRKRRPLFMSQIASIKAWFKDPGQRLKKPDPSSTSKIDLSNQSQANQENDRTKSVRISTDTGSHDAGPGYGPDHTQRNTLPARPYVSTTARSSHSRNRLSSQSPSPITPRSSYRRSTGGSGLRGRKSTSSSVSSVRSSFATGAGQLTYPPHHPSRPSHSKASSASSDRTGTSVGSPSGLAPSNSLTKQQHSRRRSSPNINAATASFVKVLPPPSSPSPLITSFSQAGAGRRVPPRINLQGTTEEDEDALNPTPSPFAGLGPPSPGLPVFAKRKRTPFRGPNLLGPGTRRRSDASPVTDLDKTDSGHLKPMAEEEEDEDGDYEDVEDAFSPIDGHDPFGPPHSKAGLSGLAEENDDDTAGAVLQESVVFDGEYSHSHAHRGLALQESPALRGDEALELDRDVPLTKWELQQ